MGRRSPRELRGNDAACPSNDAVQLKRTDRGMQVRLCRGYALTQVGAEADQQAFVAFRSRPVSIRAWASFTVSGASGQKLIAKKLRQRGDIDVTLQFGHRNIVLFPAPY